MDSVLKIEQTPFYHRTKYRKQYEKGVALLWFMMP